jgi:hypothetical protein
MAIDPRIAETILREVAALRLCAQRIEAALQVQMVAPPAAATAAPVNGAIEGHTIWIYDRWVRLTPTGRKLLAYAFGDGAGQPWEALCRYMGWEVVRAVAANLVGRLNRAIKAEMSGFPRWPHISLDGGLNVKPCGPDAKTQNSA